jgi:DNA-binding transcriptional MerR regulator
MTIDELAERTGVTSRNIRYYQTRGLLPPPEVRGRAGYYDQRHIDRLTLIQELQSEGLNLRAIGFLLGGAESVTSEELRSLKGAVLDGWVRQEPEEISTEEGLSRLAIDEADAQLARRAVALGLFEPLPGGRWRVLMPSVLDAGAELRRMGIPPERALDVLEVLEDCARTIARTFVDLVDDVIVKPFDARGRPDEDWPELRSSIERLRPLGGEALLAVYHQAMRETISAYLDGIGSDE